MKKGKSDNENKKDKNDSIRITCVLGLGHTRKTISGYYLMNKNSLFLGELFANYSVPNSEGTEKYCSCGQKYENCDFWGEIVKQPILLRPYYIIEKAKELGYNEIIIMNRLKGFYTFYALGYNPKVYVTIKNPFSWIISKIKLSKRKKEKFKLVKSMADYFVNYLFYLSKFEKEGIITKKYLNNLKKNNPSPQGTHHIYMANRTKYKLK